MFEDILERLEAGKQTVDAYVPTVRHAIEEQIPFMEEGLLDEFIEQFLEAAMSIPEYGNAHAAPLIDRLIENLSINNGEGFAHVKVLPNGKTFIFDEEVAGTADDFEEARHFSQRNQDNPELRRIFWKYGIYMPGVEGGSSETTKPWMKRAMEKLPSYDDIIAERLTIWGDKAPYWYFIENGNAGGGKPYPSFAGKHIIKQFRFQAQRAVDDFLRGLVDELENEVAKATEEALRTGSKTPPLAGDIARRNVITKSGNPSVQRWSKTTGRFLKKPRG